jgi:Fic family protein
MEEKQSIDIFTEYCQHSSYIEGERSTIAVHDCLLSWYYFYVLALEREPLTMDNILKGHELLQKHLRPDIAGKNRKVDVRVGNKICPSPYTAFHQFEEWIEKYGDATVFLSPHPEEMDIEEQIRQAHIEFEHIHPFEDGNGRIGRHIMNYQRIMFGLPLLIIREGEGQFKYYKWFNEKSNDKK